MIDYRGIMVEAINHDSKLRCFVPPQLKELTFFVRKFLFNFHFGWSRKQRKTNQIKTT
jgi:hypothetical protein